MEQIFVKNFELLNPFFEENLPFSSDLMYLNVSPIFATKFYQKSLNSAKLQNSAEMTELTKIGILRIGGLRNNFKLSTCAQISPKYIFLWVILYEKKNVLHII